MIESDKRKKNRTDDGASLRRHTTSAVRGF
jgi:hypothetical protein